MITEKDRDQFNSALVKVMIGHRKDGGFFGGRVASCNFQQEIVLTFEQILKFAKYAIEDGIVDRLEDVEFYITTITNNVRDKDELSNTISI